MRQQLAISDLHKVLEVNGLFLSVEKKLFFDTFNIGESFNFLLILIGACSDDKNQYDQGYVLSTQHHSVFKKNGYNVHQLLFEVH